ncbi:NAD(P)-dependent oxidoreductase [Phycicoccus sp. HDW14]|nr:NAD(P)-dependent oxidoreductase [Phycicoccus sp. HDW14]
MTVLLTGGAGFIGQHLARRLVGAGHEVVALDLLHPQVHADPEAAVAAFPGPVVVGDVADPAAWEGLPEGVTCVVHLAAETGTGQSMYETERYHRVNVEGTRLAAEFARARGPPSCR